MPGGFPISPGIANVVNVGADTSTSLGTVVAVSSTTDTLGSWTQLTASTGSDCAGFIVCMDNYGVGGNCWAFDIGIGAGGSEVGIAQKLVTTSNNEIIIPQYLIPVGIPAGTRIAARAQRHGSGSASGHVSMLLFDAGFNYPLQFAGVDALGFISANTHGTQITPGGSANTKGSYSEIIASTAVDYSGFFVSVDNLNATNSSYAVFLIDIAVGGSGSEIIIVPNMVGSHDSTTATGDSACSPNPSDIFWIPIPAGTRIAVRAQSNVSGSNANFGITIYGIYQ